MTSEQMQIDGKTNKTTNEILSSNISNAYAELLKNANY